MKTKRKRTPERAILLLAACAVAGPPAWGLALRNSSAERVVAGLNPGGHYTLEELQHEPLSVVNSGDEGAAVAMSVAAPRAGELNDGFEPIPDPGWIRLLHGAFSLRPGDEGRSNAVIAIPDDKRLRGGQFQAQWLSRAVSQSGLKLDLKSKLLLILAPDEREIEEARGKVEKGPGTDFQLGRSDERADGVALGRTVDLKRERGVSIKLVNLGERKATFALTPVFEEEGGAPRREGFERSPNPQFLKAERRVVEVGASGVGEARLSLDIPDQPRYRGKSWLFTVKVEELGVSPEKTGYYRLWVTTR
ncbi:MAG: hypothetical protein HY077_10855 [Elusimicrobia bacterium]|nr:hypothetical protein [Elusimicrobiota bacterium]